MGGTATSAPVLWPLVLYIVGVLAVIAGMLGVSYVLGQRHSERATGIPYESGIVSTGSARLRFLPSFFLIGVFFVIFDIETVFIFAWAVSARELGWFGYAQICVFVGVLLAALVYLWRERALEQ